MAKKIIKQRKENGEFEDVMVDFETDFSLFVFDTNGNEIKRFPGDIIVKTGLKQSQNLGFLDDDNVEIFRNGELIHSFAGQTVNGYIGRINCD